MKTVIDLVNEPFGSVEVADNVSVKTIDGIHYLLSEEEILDIADAITANLPEKMLEDCYKNRLKGYGSVGSQLDMIYHDGLDAWKAHIDLVKETYPKPE